MHGDTARSPIVAALVMVATLAPSPGTATAAHRPGSTAGTGPKARALAVAPCSTSPSRAISISDVPYTQRRFDPARIRPLATGRGITVAVIDSGVDVQHPQLAGKVLQGEDFLRDGSDGYQDCNGHGTGVASLIVAGKPKNGSTPEVDLQGLAPDAKILPVRVSEQSSIPDEQGTQDGITDEGFADSIRYAADNAQVINLSLTLERDNSDVAAAIRYAHDRNVVIVAAVGNKGAPDQGNPTPYPAAYDGVLGVGAIDQAGFRAAFSQRGPYVDVVAPGTAITMAAVGGGYLYNEGTSFASPLVAATAALLRERFPDLSADEVARRIMATTDPAPGGADSDSYGKGVINPYRALTESFAPPSTHRPAAVVINADTPAELALQRRREESRTTAFIVAGVGAGVAAIAALAALVLPRGFRRRWRAAEPS